MDDETITTILAPLNSTQQTAVKKAYAKMEISLNTINVEFDEHISMDITKEICSDAQSLRLRYAKIRIDGEKWKTKEKKPFLNAGDAIQGLYNELKSETSQKELVLKNRETHFERIAQEAIEAIKTERLTLLELYNVDSTFVDLGNMTDEAWKAHFASIVLAHEKSIEDAQKVSEEQLQLDKAQAVFESRKEVLMPYAQFNPFVDLYLETTDEEYSALLLEMMKRKADFEKEQEALIEENVSLKAKNEVLTEVVKKESSDINTFKKDIFAGFGVPASSKKEETSSDKDPSLGEMLGFDEPEKVVSEKTLTESERIQMCIDYLSGNVPYFENELAISTINSCINSLTGLTLLL